MWIFLNNAMLSIVQAEGQPPGTLTVRARRAVDIRRLFPNAEIIKTPHADYTFRSIEPRSDITALLTQRVMDLDYNNFKQQVREPDRHSAYFRVWQIMEQFQRKNDQ